jgi:hypothetical protein
MTTPPTRAAVLKDYVPVPASALGPALNEQGRNARWPSG